MLRVSPPPEPLKTRHGRAAHRRVDRGHQVAVDRVPGGRPQLPHRHLGRRRRPAGGDRGRDLPAAHGGAQRHLVPERRRERLVLGVAGGRDHRLEEPHRVGAGVAAAHRRLVERDRAGRRGVEVGRRRPGRPGPVGGAGGDGGAGTGGQAPHGHRHRDVVARLRRRDGHRPPRRVGAAAGGAGARDAGQQEHRRHRSPLPAGTHGHGPTRGRPAACPGPGDRRGTVSR